MQPLIGIPATLGLSLVIFYWQQNGPASHLYVSFFPTIAPRKIISLKSKILQETRIQAKRKAFIWDSAL